jgi:exodeoxyribonuclease V alpha subunit
MQKIRCVVERITYQNPENGYSVLKCRVKDYSDLIPVIGNLIDANVGSVLIIEGNTMSLFAAEERLQCRKSVSAEVDMHTALMTR